MSRRRNNNQIDEIDDNETATNNDINSIDNNSDRDILLRNNIEPKIQVFKGTKDKISIENWLKRFEMISQYYNWIGEKQILSIGVYYGYKHSKFQDLFGSYS